jgi:integrase
MRKNYALTPQQKIDARDAIELLDGSNLTLLDAARLALHLKPGSSAETKTVDQAMGLFLNAAIRKKMNPGTLAFYDNHLASFCRYFTTRKMDDVTRAELRAWLQGQPLAPETIRGKLRAIRAMWRWGLRQDPPFCNDDATSGLQLDLPKTTTNDRFLTVDQVDQVMGAAGIYTATLACVFFAGIRIEEVRARHDIKPPIVWGNIDQTGKTIRVEAGKNKARVQEGLPANFWAWLEYGRTLLIAAGYPAGDGDPICPHEVKQATALARRTLGIWPKNCHRHSFITYHVAKYKNTGTTSELIGHEGRVQLLHSRYKGRVSEAMGTAYFSLFPTNPKKTFKI